MHNTKKHKLNRKAAMQNGSTIGGLNSNVLEKLISYITIPRTREIDRLTPPQPCHVTQEHHGRSGQPTKGEFTLSNLI